jgi:hypothetical protein
MSNTIIDLDSYTERLEKNYPTFKHYLYHGEASGVQSWLKTHVPHDVVCQKSFLKIVNHNHIDFHFAADNVQEEQKKAGRLAIAQHLDGSEQIRFINFLFTIEHIVDVDYFHLVKKNNEHHQKLPEVLDDRFWKLLITSLFHEEKFATLEEIERIFNHDFLNQQSDSFHLIFNHQQNFIDEPSKQAFLNIRTWHLRVDDAKFFPYYDIMFDYSEEKEHYLQYKNITLPSYEDYLRTQAIYQGRLGMNTDNDQLVQYTLSILKHHMVRTYYHQLDEHLPHSDNHNDILLPKIKI